MEAEVELLTGASKGVRASLRENHCNGCRDRDWGTRTGRIELATSKLRKGSYFPSFLEPGRTAEKALVAVIQEAYVHGVSTRAVDDLVKAMGQSGSKLILLRAECRHFLASDGFASFRISSSKGESG